MSSRDGAQISEGEISLGYGSLHFNVMFDLDSMDS